MQERLAVIFGALRLHSSLSRRAFSITRCAHVTQADRQESKHEMKDLDDPVKFADHHRRLVQADDDRDCADDESTDCDDPAAGFGKGLGDADHPERRDRQKTEQHMYRD